MATKNPTKMMTFTNEADARTFMVLRNRAMAKHNDVVVMVEGPGDDEFTVMDLRSAIDDEFLYSWAV
jgi:hypothetical protein